MFSIPTFAGAQQPTSGLRVGDAVRFTRRDDGTDHGFSARYRCEGIISGFSSDTVLVAADRNCATAEFAMARLSEVKVKRGDRGSRIRHFTFGALLGTVVGGVIGRVRAGDGCHVAPCDDAGFAIGILTVTGAAVGGLIGGGVGLVIPAGRQWVPLPRILIRVAPIEPRSSHSNLSP